MKRFRVPERCSPEWWTWIASATTFFAVVSFAGLYYFGILEGLFTLVGAAVAISIAGDIVVAYSFEAIAPSRISLAPGERARHDEEISLLGTIESGFDSRATGRIIVRGEHWNARHYQGLVVDLKPGTKIRIVGREGLTLLIREVG